MTKSTCADGAWHDLWVAWHNNPHEQLYMPRVALEEVMECHPRAVHGVVRNKPAPNAKELLVDRGKMWEFLQEHGRVCGRNVGE